MNAERFKMDLISQNISNANTQAVDPNNYYHRKIANVQSADGEQFSMPASLSDDDEDSQVRSHGVKSSNVIEDPSGPKWVYDPTNPNAMKNGEHKGYVAMSNVNMISEMTNLIATSRAYEANSSVVEAVKGMASKGLEIGR